MALFKAAAAAFLAKPLLVAGATTFITLGDWGGKALGGYHATDTDDVAAQMGTTAQQAGISFVVNVGDNFYYCGIQNDTDFQLKTDFEDVYTAPSLNVPWYSILGNHEYGYNVDAQISYKDPQGRWVMDARYYTKRVEISTGVYISFIFLDTSPCVQEYRSSDPSGWDPCGSDFPTCSPINEGPCEFNANILTQDCSAQYTWFQNALAQVPADDWLIVAGHHMANEINVQDFLTPLEQHGFDLYLNGHVHTLEHYSLNGLASYVTSGAGAMVRTEDQHHTLKQVHVNATPTTVFNQKVAGFTLHTFSDDYTQLRTDFITYAGETVHTFTVTKGSGPGPSPGPSPGPGPSPAGSCETYGCYYEKGQSCQCNSYCNYYKDCCSDYEEVCGGSSTRRRRGSYERRRYASTEAPKEAKPAEEINV